MDWKDLPMDMDLQEKRQLLRRVMALDQESSSLARWALACRVIDGRPFSFRRHEYLYGIYDDLAASMVIRKAAQMGGTECTLSRALFFAVRHGGRTIYFFPTFAAVSQFCRDRFDPAIEQSPYLRSLRGDTDNVALKRFGQGWIYFRGTSSRTQMKSVPGDGLVFDEVDEMKPAHIELARQRLGHSEWGWEVMLSSPTLPLCGIDRAYEASDQRHFLLSCPGCSRDWCLEDVFLEHHGGQHDPRREIVFVRGEPGRENLVCLYCGRALDPAQGRWAAKYPGRSTHGYQLNQFLSPIISRADREAGCETRAASLLRKWQTTRFPGEFFNSIMGLPYLAAEGGLTEQDLLTLAGRWTQPPAGTACSMGVDQGNGLHIVIKEPHEDRNMVLTVKVHHEPVTDAVFSHLDHLMETYDVRFCVIDALPNTHAARAFANRFRGRVWLAYYADTQKGGISWGFDQEGTPTVTINRTESLDAWRDVHKLRRRRIPKVEDEVSEYVRQMTNVLRKVQEDPETGQKKAIWIQRGPDHFAHSDAYAEVALRRATVGLVHGTVIAEE